MPRRERRIDAHASRLDRLAEATGPSLPPMPEASDAAAWCALLVDPETGRPFELYEEQVVFLRAAFTLTSDGRLPYPEIVFGAPKKSGKTALAAMAALYVAAAIGGRFAEVYIYANDLDQATGRVFQACARIVEATPWLAARAVVYRDRIEFPATGAAIRAMASDAASAAGSNPSLSIFDELWAYTGERAHRLWDEAVPSPTRRVSGRLTVTYAGFEGESEPLESLYRRGVSRTQVAPDLYAGEGQLTYWTHELRAPWQSDDWREQMRGQLRASAYLRMIENRWTSGEGEFLPVAWWDACTDPQLRPVLVDPRLPVWVGVDASVRRDSTAVVAVTFDRARQRVRLARHVVFQPTPDRPLDFEATVEALLRDWQSRYSVRQVVYDPYQLVSTAQRLRLAGLPMVEFPQTLDRLTAMSSNLYTIVKDRNLVAYPADDLRLAITRAVAIETPRGTRIGKTNQAHKIDLVVALAMATLAASQGGPTPPSRVGTFEVFPGGVIRRFGPRRMGPDHLYPSPYTPRNA